MYWIEEVWADFRPLFIRLTVDLLLFLMFWGVLWVVHIVSVRMPVSGLAGEILVTVHEYGLALNYAAMTLLAAYDIWKFKFGSKR